MTAALAQLVQYRMSESVTCAAVIIRVVSGDTVHLVPLMDTGDGWLVRTAPAIHRAELHENVSKGPDAGQWQDSVVPDPIAAAPAAGVQSPRALDTTFTPSTSHGGRAVQLSVSGTLRCQSTLLSPQTAAVELRSDSQITPTTTRVDASFTLEGVVATCTVPFFLSYEVPAGETVRLVTSGAGTVTITAINETAR